MTRPKSNAPARRVALLIESSRAYGRGLLSGIARYVRTHGRWSVAYRECRLGDFSPDWLKPRTWDGIIARVPDLLIAQEIVRSRCPAVDVLGQVGHPRMLSIYPDDAQVARLAATHLLDTGFRTLAFCGYPGVRYSDTRGAVFERLVQEAGRACFRYPAPGAARKISRRRSSEAVSWEQQGQDDQAALVRWLQQLPTPVAVLACNSIRGQEVLSACRRLGRAVPEQVAVMGVDSDEIICELSDPPLSSVVLNAVHTGYEAAAWLDRLMAGEAAPDSPVLIAPTGVAPRRSTDIVAVDDPYVAAALRYIRDHACEDIALQDVLQSVHLSRASLHRHFNAALGRSPKAEILRVRLQRAKQLLAETELPLYEIASRTGFRNPEHFSYLFKSKSGQTPGQFRREAKASGKPIVRAQNHQAKTIEP